MPELEILYLSEDDVKNVGLGMGETVKTVEEAFRAYGDSQVVVPDKLHFDFGAPGEGKASGNSMPAYVGPWNVGGIKWVGMNFDNPQKYGIPTILATIILADANTGAPLSIICANQLTAMRTGAATAIGAKYLANHNSERVCIVGAGYQGRFQLSALNEVCKIRDVVVADMNKEAAELYSKEMGNELGLDIKPTEDIKEAVSDADIIATSTTAKEPILMEGWLKEGCFIGCIGTIPELEDKLILSMDKIIADVIGPAMHTGVISGVVKRGLLTKDDVYAELGEVVAGKKKGRESEQEKILNVFRGIAINDLAVGYKIYQLAKEKGIGQRLPI